MHTSRLRVGAALVAILLSGPQDTPASLIDQVRQLLTRLEQLLIPDPPPPDPTTFVDVGGDLQAALNAATPDRWIELSPVGTYTGNFIIRVSGTKLRTRGALIPGRVDPAVHTDLAEVRSGNGGPVLAIRPGVTDVTVSQIDFGEDGGNDRILVGAADASQVTRDQQPRRIVFDQVIVRGHPTNGAKRGIAMQGADITLRRSHLSNFFLVGQDSQAVGGWNGEGPFLLENNYLEGAGENVMFGGADPTIPGMVPGNITIRGNTITKPLAWRATSYTIKNLIECKACDRISIEDNDIGPTWAAGQAYAIVLTPSDPEGAPANPAVVVRNVSIRRNRVVNVPGGINLLGYSQYQALRPTQPTVDVTVEENLFVISRATLGGQGWFLMLGNAPTNVAVRRNTIVTDGNQFIQGNPAGFPPGFSFTGNLVSTIGVYGTFLSVNGTNYNRGDQWQTYFPGGVVQGNGFIGDQSRFRTNFPDNLHVPTCLARDAAGVCTQTAASLVVDGYGTGVLEPYGRPR